MNALPLFLIVATALILSPGPGVVHTLSNSIRYGVRGSVSGILGIASGTFVVATVAATGLGLLVSTSAVVFAAIKYAGAAYLIYLGIRHWRAAPAGIGVCLVASRGWRKRFVEGALIQILNPKVILFFMSIFPQFIDYSSGYFGQFAVLVTTYSVLVVGIHLLYAFLAGRARDWLASPARERLVRRTSGITFVGFGIGMAAANR